MTASRPFFVPDVSVRHSFHRRVLIAPISTNSTSLMMCVHSEPMECVHLAPFSSKFDFLFTVW